MKHISLFKWLFLAALVPAVASCDDIDEADRIITEDKETTIVGAEEVTIEANGETFTFERENRLLIEDFTGWKCVNCPAIADYLTRKITPVYPSVLVSLHMNSNSFSKNHPEGFNCASADTICDNICGTSIASLISLPSVFINNSNFADKAYSSDTTELSNKALELYSQGLSIKAKQDVAVNVQKVEDGKYNLSTYINYENAKHACKLQLWLIEENLISSKQQSATGWIRNYENHGVLRMVLNGSCSGQMVTLDDHDATVLHHTVDIKDKDYQPSNCRVVAIVLSPEGNTVVNCIAVSLE